LQYILPQFPAYLGISGNYVSDIENGKVEPKQPILLSIKLRYSINPEQILKGEGFSLAKLEKFSTIKENEEKFSINDKQTGYNKDRDNKKTILLEMTSEILDSGTEHAEVLKTSINAIYRSFTKEKIQEKDIKKLKQRMNNLEKKEKYKIEDVGSV